MQSNNDRNGAGDAEQWADRGEPVTPRDLWVAVSTEYIFRWPSVRMADSHSAVAQSGVGTYCYLFTWESPAFDGAPLP